MSETKWQRGAIFVQADGHHWHDLRSWGEDIARLGPKTFVRVRCDGFRADGKQHVAALVYVERVAS